MNSKYQMTGKILRALLVGGAWMLAASSPYFTINLIKHLERESKRKNRLKRGRDDKYKEKFRSAFYSLKRRELIDIERRGNQIYISLTEEGKRRAGKYQIDDLEIEKPGKWDGKWRLLIFDIAEKQRIKREAMRGKIKELGLYQVQKSVWLYPYDFQREMKLLRHFFGLTEDEMQLMTVSEIENEQKLKKYFRI